jgi:sporulation protein YlmC with PRC-barrel domain
MEDLGGPASYLTLERGMPVYSSDGVKVGKIEHVLADFRDDVFEGIVLDKSVLLGGHRFVDATQIDEIHERGVILKLDREAAERLPKRSENPGEIDLGPDDMVPDELRDKLRRAWGRISGKG